MRFWKSENAGLEAELRGTRPTPSDEFVRLLARHVDARSRNRTLDRLSRLSLAMSVTVLMVGMLASFGGLSYAASAPREAVEAVKAAVAPDNPRVVQASSAQAQYAPPRVTICHVTPSGNQITLTLPEPAATAHLAQHEDDYLGPCTGGAIAGAGGGGTVGGGGVAGTGGGGTLGAGGTLPFTGLSLAGTVLLSGLLMGTGFVLRRRATAIN